MIFVKTISLLPSYGDKTSLLCKFPIFDNKDPGFDAGTVILGSNGKGWSEAPCDEIFETFQCKLYSVTRKTLLW
jgi:hypothetical protein